MKKSITIVAAIFAVTALNAQDYHPLQSMQMGEVIRISASIFAVALFMIFFLTILKRGLEYRLKNKIVDKGIAENIASSLLRTKTSEDRNINIKWFALLAGIGAGLTIIYFTQPLGIHSLAIMAFSISVSFLGYYIFLRTAGK